jgi:hypothetical protein
MKEMFFLADKLHEWWKVETVTIPKEGYVLPFIFAFGLTAKMLPKA